MRSLSTGSRNLIGIYPVSDASCGYRATSNSEQVTGNDYEEKCL